MESTGAREAGLMEPSRYDNIYRQNSMGEIWGFYNKSATHDTSSLLVIGDFLSFSFQPPIAAAIFFIGLRSTSTVFAVTSVKLSEFA
jgi:hypothetical protein